MMTKKLIKQAKNDIAFLKLIYGNDWENNSDLSKDIINSPTIHDIYIRAKLYIAEKEIKNELKV